ncbi:MAG: glycosyltransferase family 2 protein [Nanoarchaeota archaeon]
MATDTYIVIAAYNEEKAIANVVKGLQKEGYQHIIVVDDGSKDKTAAQAEKAGAKALRHIINRGQGAALRTGITYALKNGAHLLVTFDADGQHDPADIKKMIAPVAHGECDVTLGSRFLRRQSADKVPFFRKMILKLAILFTWIVNGIRLTDVHNGLRCLSRTAAQKIMITSSRMEHASEILEEIKRKKLRYKEIPVTIAYTDYSKMKGQSSMKSIEIGLKLLVKKLMR